MKNKSTFITLATLAAMVVGSLILLGAFVLAHWSTVEKSVSSTASPVAQPVIQHLVESDHIALVPVVDSQTQTGPAQVITQGREMATNTHVINPTQKPSRTKPAIQDPVARLALSQVGADPEANAYWFQAINDPSLPAEERKDLIEDLNEDGLSDPHHPTPEDMPLIASRIQLLEELAPTAMDRVNADAFGEAYKDLVNLYTGHPAD